MRQEESPPGSGGWDRSSKARGVPAHVERSLLLDHLFHFSSASENEKLIHIRFKGDLRSETFQTTPQPHFLLLSP